MLTKKTGFVWATALSVLAACQSAETKQTASITGNITGLTDSVVYIMGLGDEESAKDSAVVKDGKFTWTGKVTDARKVYLQTPQRYMEFYMENAPVQINGTMDSLYYAKVTGSASQDEYVAFNDSQKEITDKMYALFPLLHEAKEDAVKAQLEEQIDSLRKIRRASTEEYIRKHPTSPVSVGLIADMAVIGGEFSHLNGLYNTLDLKAQQTVTGKKLAKRLEVVKRSSIGEPFKAFTQNDKDGKPVNTAAFKGKVILVDFWASWCGPCRAENPNVLKAYNKYKDKGFDVLGISLDDKADKWKEAIEKDGMPWTQISDLKGYDNEISTWYGIQAIPSTMLLDTNGVIIAKDLRGAALHKKLEEVFN